MPVKEIPVIWLQGGGCSGCTVSLANSKFPSLRNILIDQLLPGAHLNLLYHPTLMAGEGEQAFSVLEEPPDGYVLAVEGAIPENERFCTIGEKNGEEATMLAKFVELARDASLVLAVGTCSSFGGIPSGHPNPGQYRPAHEIMQKHDIEIPVVNVPGCPPHPDWITTTLSEFMLASGTEGVAVDKWHRPLTIYGQLIHENCPRRAYFDEGKFAETPGDPECLYELGCKGPITYADCPVREWNGGTNWCVGAGGPCNGCTQPEYIDEVTPLYRKLPEDALPKIGQVNSPGDDNE
ncbi:MAG: hydrogenase small subunit [Candidatus Brocadiia bacterium]